jgi:hypothetical protein
MISPGRPNRPPRQNTWVGWAVGTVAAVLLVYVAFGGSGTVSGRLGGVSSTNNGQVRRQYGVLSTQLTLGPISFGALLQLVLRRQHGPLSRLKACVCCAV